MSKLENIINGWSNYLQPDDPATLELAKELSLIHI